MSQSVEELRAAIDEAQWSWLRPHLERGGLIVVDGDLDLARVGLRVAEDDVAAIGSWIAEGRVSKPSLEQISAWNEAAETTFDMLIVSPYVLIQLKPPRSHS